MGKSSIINISIINMDENNLNTDGVAKKIINQNEAFKNLGFSVAYTGIKNNGLYIFEEKKEIFLCKSSRFPFHNRTLMYKHLLKWFMENGFPDYSYFRYHGSDMAFIMLLKRMQAKGIKVLLEFPTFPYDGERRKNIKSLISLFQDRFWRTQLKKYVNYSINFNGFKRILNINSVDIDNSINVERIQVHNWIRQENEIHIIAVALMNKWHGYDRIIEGLNDYYSSSDIKKTKIYLHLVGDGPSIPEYKTLTQRYELDKYVIFHGKLGGNNLDELYNKCDIAASSLGIFRIGLQSVSTLKVREYCARGIPFIIGYDEISLNEELNFLSRFPNDNSPISMDSIKDFHNSFINNENVVLEMREFAKENFTWEKQFDKVFSKL